LVLSATGAPVALVNRFIVRLPGTEARLVVVTLGRVAMEFLFYCERRGSGNSPPMEQSCSGSRGTPVRRPRYNCALSEMALTVLLRLARSCGDHLALRSGSKSRFGSSDPPGQRFRSCISPIAAHRATRLSRTGTIPSTASIF
jgi:hypothetical protein